MADLLGIQSDIADLSKRLEALETKAAADVITAEDHLVAALRKALDGATITLKLPPEA